MKVYVKYITTLLIVSFALICSDASSQQTMLGMRLQAGDGITNTNFLLLAGPAGATGFTGSYTLRFPAAGPTTGALPYLTDGAGQLGWLPASTNGFILTQAGGVPTWANPASTLWSLSGNATTTAWNGTSG